MWKLTNESHVILSLLNTGVSSYFLTLPWLGPCSEEGIPQPFALGLYGLLLSQCTAAANPRPSMCTVSIPPVEMWLSQSLRSPRTQWKSLHPITQTFHLRYWKILCLKYLFYFFRLWITYKKAQPLILLTTLTTTPSTIMKLVECFSKHGQCKVSDVMYFRHVS